MQLLSDFEYYLIKDKANKHFCYQNRQINLNSDIDTELDIFRQKVEKDFINELDNNSELIFKCIEHWVNYYQSELKKIYFQSIKSRV